MQDFLRLYPKPQNPEVYTGLFAIPLERREWSNLPNKRKHGVSQTQFADAMEVCLDEAQNISLFDFFHGKCAEFADCFHSLNPEWVVVDMRRGGSWNNLIHSFCTRKQSGKILFADARGITDDPETFFSDFTCSKNIYVEPPKGDPIPCTDACRKAYELLEKCSKRFFLNGGI